MNDKLNVKTEYRFEVEMFRGVDWTDVAICEALYDAQFHSTRFSLHKAEDTVQFPSNRDPRRHVQYIISWSNFIRETTKMKGNFISDFLTSGTSSHLLHGVSVCLPACVFTLHPPPLSLSIYLSL